MIRYEVVLTPIPEIHALVEHWMRTEHIPAILATRCFLDISFSQSGEHFRTVYHAEHRADLDRYLTEYADGMRENFKLRFGEGVAVSRSVWQELERWERPTPP